MDFLTQLANEQQALALLEPHATQLLGGAARISQVEVLRAWRRTWAKPAQRDREYLQLYLRLRGRTRAGTQFTRAIHGVAGNAERLPKGRDYAHRIEWTQGVLCFERLPRDRALPQLAELMMRNCCALALPVSAREWLGGQPQSVTLVSYRPGERAVLRVARAERAVYGKLFADARAATLVQRLGELQLAAARANGAPALPPLLGHDPERQVVWFAELAGRGADQWLATAYGPQWVGRVLGRALACWHRMTPPAQLPRLARPQLLLEAERKLRKLELMEPSLTRIAQSLRSRLPDALASLPEGEAALLHGDVHPKQFIIDNSRRVGVCDFDEVAVGDAERDLAQLIVRIGGHDIIDTWLRHARRPLRESTLRWYVALSHVDRGYRELSMRGSPALPSAASRLEQAMESCA